MSKQTDNEDEIYTRERESARKLFDSFSPVTCPALAGRQIHFTSEGFNHLLFKKPKKPRVRQDQVIRFGLLNEARELISRTTTIQELDVCSESVVVKKFKRKERVIDTVRYWGFVAIMNRRRIKVLVRQIGNKGQLHFWSVIPNWGLTKIMGYRLRNNANGNLQED